MCWIQREAGLFTYLIIPLQKARLARIRIAKASSGAAFVSKKKAAEARLAAQESGVELDDAGRDEDIFELQHHHLLRCLERTTVRFFSLLWKLCLVGESYHKNGINVVVKQIEYHKKTTKPDCIKIEQTSAIVF